MSVCLLPTMYLSYRWNFKKQADALRKTCKSRLTNATGEQGALLLQSDDCQLSQVRQLSQVHILPHLRERVFLL